MARAETNRLTADAARVTAELAAVTAERDRLVREVPELRSRADRAEAALEQLRDALRWAENGRG